MPKRNPFILCFASVKHPTRVSLFSVDTLHLWQWALLNPDLLMVTLQGIDFLNSFLQLWCLPLAHVLADGISTYLWEEVEAQLSFTLCEPLGVDLTKEPWCVGRFAVISSQGSWEKEILFKSMSAVGIYQSLTLPIDSLGLRQFPYTNGRDKLLKHWLSLVSKVTLISLGLSCGSFVKTLRFLLPLQGT